MKMDSNRSTRGATIRGCLLIMLLSMAVNDLFSVNSQQYGTTLGGFTIDVILYGAVVLLAFYLILALVPVILYVTLLGFGVLARDSRVDLYAFGIGGGLLMQLCFPTF